MVATKQHGARVTGLTCGLRSDRRENGIQLRIMFASINVVLNAWVLVSGEVGKCLKELPTDSIT